MKLASGETLAQTELGVAILPAGIYFSRIDSVEVKRNKAGDGDNLFVHHTLLSNAEGDIAFEAIDGKVIENRGQFKLTDCVCLTVKGGYTEDMLNQNLKRYALAIGLAEDEDLHVEEKHFAAVGESSRPLPGVHVKVKLKVREKTDKWPARNEIDKVYAIKDVDNFDADALPPF